MKFLKTVLGTIFFLFVGLVTLGVIVGDGDSPVNKASPELTREERATSIAALDAEVRDVPARDLEENLRLYRKLQTLDPTNERYEQKAAYYQDKRDEARNMERYPERFVKVTEFSWRTEAFGSVMEVDLTIENLLPVEVKDIKVKCTLTAPSGTVVDTNKRTIYEIIGAGKTMTFNNFNMGFIHSQADRSNCTVTEVTRMG